MANNRLVEIGALRGDGTHQQPAVTAAHSNHFLRIGIFLLDQPLYATVEIVERILLFAQHPVPMLKTVQQKLMAYEKEHPDTSDNSSTSGVSPTTGHRTETSNQMDFICAVVAQECNSDYQGSLAVISCVTR